MAVIKWNGGASSTAQISTVTLNNDFNNSETALSITLTAEDGSTTQAVSIDPSGVDETTIAVALHAACAASTQTLFQRATFTQSTNVVTITANVSGVPFYFASAVTGGAGTTTDATGTANTGPNDWNTAANWEGGTKPSGSDDVLINGSDYAILHGLDQSALSFGSVRVGPTMRADVGNSSDGYAVQCDATTLTIETTSGKVLFAGDTTDTVITATQTSTSAVRLSGLHASLVVNGSQVSGTVDLTTGASAGTITWNGTSRSSKLTASAGVTCTNLRFGTGTADWRGGNITNLDLFGGTFIQRGSGALTTADVVMGTYDYRSSGTIASLQVLGGVATLANSEVNSVTITACNVIAGTLDLRSGLDNVTFTGNPTVKAGLIMSDRVQTVNPKV